MLTLFQDHPWVTKNGRDPLLSAEENTANPIEPPTEEETNQAITGNLSNILVLVGNTFSCSPNYTKHLQMKAVRRFKDAVARKTRRPAGMAGILGKDSRLVQPPLSMSRPEKPPLYHKTRSVDTHDRRPLEQALVAEGIHRNLDLEDYEKAVPEREDTAITYSPKTPTKRPSDHTNDPSSSSPKTPSKRALNANPQDHRPPTHSASAPQPIAHEGKGQAHDPLTDHLYLGLGPSGGSEPPSPPAVSESPPAVEEPNIYETAYHKELERLRAERGKSATLFLTRRVEGREEYQHDDELVKGNVEGGSGQRAKSGIARVLDQAR